MILYRYNLINNCICSFILSQIFRMDKDVVKSCLTIHCVQDTKADLVDGNLHFMFVSGSHHLLVYNQYPMYCLYRYNLEG